MASEEKNETSTKAAAPDAAKPEAAGAAKVAVVKKAKKNVASGRAYVYSSFNNTLVTFTDSMGNAVAWSSAGSNGFRGSRKNTPFAAQVAAEEASRKAVENGMRSVHVYVSGPGAGRESALRAMGSAGLRVTYIEDTTPIPHNGCRPPKRRRV